MDGRASQMVLVVKNLPANAGKETPVLSLGREDPLEEGTATHCRILAWDRGAWPVTVPWGHTESDMTEET